MKKILRYGLLVASLVPAVSFAAANDIGGIISTFYSMLQGIPTLLIALAVIYFLWGVLQYASGGDEKTRGDAKIKVIYGLIAIIIMTSVWGLVQVLGNSVGVQPGSGAKPSAPSI